MMMQLMESVPANRNRKEHAAALEQAAVFLRIREQAGFEGKTWNQLNWYTEFARRDLEDLSDGDLLNLQHKMLALCWVAGKALAEYPLLPLNKIRTLHKKVSNHLANLMDHGTSNFETVSYTVMVSRLSVEILPTRLSPGYGPFLTSHFHREKKFSNCNTPESEIEPVLLDHMSELIPELGHFLSRCPKCHKVFLRFRKHAKFCSRDCQSQRAAEITRQRKKEEKVNANLSQKKRRGPAPKKRK